ncbi:N-acetylmannosamine-6-phosphate 2-epimerase [Vagococcus elongatus]|uniref:Putative N-acetylmannosamine-6-phosphate 2-epimerase n=1 Tax=Vagococcus elongatus TaxID=180344 RepID=A0A430AQD3_9ENTE|nr:N-acetylmannosamine-6-phosphate 2-epimerase [Vagococcus elongatus]RSU10332.1 N-acetylmannosamine-6-phosphate 2-epimerase [Vagococcus elongatus]
MENKTLKHLKDNLIVSCQALEEEPLHSSFIMSRMALAAVQSGAVGIRANSVKDIKAIQETVSVPIIGILKKVYPDSPVFITPTLAEVREICATGVEIVAMDATLRKRPNEEKLKDIVTTIKAEYPNTLLMADTSSIADVKKAEEIGFEIIGTTLYGYTDETQHENIADDDFIFLKEVLKATNLPVIAEGKIDTPLKARKVLELGCHCVVIGGAITRPQQITLTFVSEINKMGKGNKSDRK